MASRHHRALLWSGVAGAALTAAAFAVTVTSMWPRSAVAEYRQVTYRKGAVSSARFTPDGQSFVYSASWEGQPYGAFLGRPESPDARDLQLPDARVTSISRAGDMAVLFGPQNVIRVFGQSTLARIPMAGGARRDVLTGVMDADWIAGTDSMAVIRDPGGGRPWTVEFPAGTKVHEARAAWSLRVSPDGSRVAFFEGPLSVFDSAPQSMITVIDKGGRKSTVARDWSGFGLAWAPSGDEIWFTALRPSQSEPARNCVLSRSRELSARCTARPIGLCYMTSPLKVGFFCRETRFGSTLPVNRQGRRVNSIWDGWSDRLQPDCHPMATP